MFYVIEAFSILINNKRAFWLPSSESSTKAQPQNKYCRHFWTVSRPVSLAIRVERWVKTPQGMKKDDRHRTGKSRWTQATFLVDWSHRRFYGHAIIMHTAHSLSEIWYMSRDSNSTFFGEPSTGPSNATMKRLMNLKVAVFTRVPTKSNDKIAFF